MHFVKKRKNKSASYMWSNCTKTLIFNVEEFTFDLYTFKKVDFFLMLWVCFQWKHLCHATLLLRNSRVIDMTEGELEFVPWAWPFNCGETEFRMTTVLKKVLQDHVMFHSFQMTNMPISQVFCRGTGRRVVRRSGEREAGQASLSVSIWFCWMGSGQVCQGETLIQKMSQGDKFRWLPESSYALSSLAVVFIQSFLVCLFFHKSSYLL